MALLRATYVMKKQLTTILLLVSALGFSTGMASEGRWQTLRAINWVENPTNHTRIGRYGELGPYQFRPATWRMHTTKPFRLAADRAAADEVAVKHYEWIKRTLERAGVDATPFNIALAWNSGVDNVLKGRAPVVAYDYATRVTNLVDTLTRQTAVAKAKAAPVSSVSSGGVRPVPVISLDTPVVNFAVGTHAPRFELVLPPEPEMPVVYTDRESEATIVTTVEPSVHTFTFTTAATLTPRFSL